MRERRGENERERRGENERERERMREIWREREGRSKESEGERGERRREKERDRGERDLNGVWKHIGLFNDKFIEREGAPQTLSSLCNAS